MELEIARVVNAEVDAVICIARCVSGSVHVGDRIVSVGRPGGGAWISVEMTVREVRRYGRVVDFFDAPHTAELHLSGDGRGKIVEGAKLQVG